MLWKQLLYDYWKRALIAFSFFIVLVSSFLFKPVKSEQSLIQTRNLSLNIVGDVNQPGIYQIPSQMNIQEAIDKFAKGIKQVEDPHIEVTLQNPDKKPFEPVRINTATLNELQTIPGVGQAKAQKIIDYRNQHGLFHKPEDLMGVSGFGKSTVEKLLPYITFISK